MQPLNLATGVGAALAADVAVPQGQAFGQFACQSGYLSTNVHTGRVIAARSLNKGAAQSALSKTLRSRACRAPKSPYWPCAWSLSLRVAQRKLKKRFTLTNRLSPPSRPSPANTSKTTGRALAGLMARPALILPCSENSAKNLQLSRNRFAPSVGLPYGAPICKDETWRIQCVPQPSSPLSPSAPSRLAPRKKLRSKQLRLTCRLNRLKPANTSNLTALNTGRALWPAFATPTQPSFGGYEVALC